MGKTLTEIAEQLKSSNKKVQLIYAFNGVGKTRLSRKFIKPDDSADEPSENIQDAYFSNKSVLYYNAITEDLFYWDNESNGEVEQKMNIRQNPFIDWIIGERGQDQNIITNFQRYTDKRITPAFIEKDKSDYHNGKRIIKKTFSEVNFSFTRGDERSENIKISKGEERNFVWSIFFSLLEEIAGILSEKDPDKRDDNQFDSLKYVFIDDPVSSLDENHLIEMAIDLARLTKSLTHTLSFIITTHSPLFYNVLNNEFSKNDDKLGYKSKQTENYRLERQEDGLLELQKQPHDHPFSYHLFLLSELIKVKDSGQIKKYHFNFLRNILEKTATFLGYNNWAELLRKDSDGRRDPFALRIINLSSHSAHAGDEIAEPDEKDKEKLIEVTNFIINKYGFLQENKKL